MLATWLGPPTEQRLARVPGDIVSFEAVMRGGSFFSGPEHHLFGALRDADPAEAHFLDQTNYEQYAIPCDDLADEVKYLVEDLEGIFALIYNDQCVGIQLPVTVELKVVQCDPGIKGASATSRSKPATLETGLIVQVPEYLAEGERIKVDTRTGEYLSRA